MDSSSPSTLPAPTECYGCGTAASGFRDRAADEWQVTFKPVDMADYGYDYGPGNGLTGYKCQRCGLITVVCVPQLDRATQPGVAADD